MKQLFTNFDDSSSCKLELGGLYDEDGNEMCTNEDLSDVPVVAGKTVTTQSLRERRRRCARG